MASLLIDKEYISQLWFPEFGNTFFITMDGNCLPNTNSHKYELQLFRNHLSEEVIVEYDIVECGLAENGKYEFVYKAFACSGLEEITRPSVKIRLSFHRPVDKLIAKFKKPVDTVELHIPGGESGIFYLEFKKVSDTEFILDLGEKTINFSYIPVCYLLISSDGSNNDCVILSNYKCPLEL